MCIRDRCCPAERRFEFVFVVFSQETAVQIARIGDVEQPLRMTDNGFGKEAAPGKNRERITKGDEIPGDCVDGVRSFDDQSLQVMDGIVAIRQRVQKGLDDTQHVRRQQTEHGRGGGHALVIAKF